MPLAPALTVSAHLEHCAECRHSVDLFEEIGGLVLNALADAAEDEPGALGRAVLALAAKPAEVLDTILPVECGRQKMPLSLSAMGLGRRRHLAPDLWVARANSPKVDGWRTLVLSLPAGTRIPVHCHSGGEFVYVISGSYTDGSTTRSAGDFAQADGAIEHQLTVGSSGPCVCMISTQAPLQWKGWATLLRPLLGL